MTIELSAMAFIKVFTTEVEVKLFVSVDVRNSAMTPEVVSASLKMESCVLWGVSYVPMCVTTPDCELASTSATVFIV
jgi:hypothetical protein